MKRYRVYFCRSFKAWRVHEIGAMLYTDWIALSWREAIDRAVRLACGGHT